MSNPVVKFPAIASMGVPAFECEIPEGTSGRFLVYKVPACEAYPEGLWYAMETFSNSRMHLEPSCEAWNKEQLLAIRFSKEGEEGGESAGKLQVSVEFKHAAVQLDMAALQPAE